MDMDSDSSSDDTSGDYTTETSSSSEDDSMMEIAEIDGTKLQLPQGMCEKKEIFQSILSLDTYNNVLTDENRKYLQQFLPKFPEPTTNDNTEQTTSATTTTVEKLFNYENFYFNNPLEQFYSNLKAGHYRPDIANMKRLILKCEEKESKLRYKKLREKLKYDVIESHKKLTEQINNLPPGIEPKFERSHDHNHNNNNNDLILYRTKRRYYQILSNINNKVNDNNDDYYSPDENYPEGPPVNLSRKQRRHLNSIKNSNNNGERFTSTMSTKLQLDLEKYITPQKNPFYITDENYRILLNQHKRRRLDKTDDPELNTRNITIMDIINRTQLPYLKNLFINNNNNNNNRNNHIDNKFVNNSNSQNNRKKGRSRDTSNSDTDSDSSSLNPNKTQKMKLTKPKKIKTEIKKEIVEVVRSITPTITPTTTIVETLIPPKFELIEQTYANYFSLIRDIICKTPEHRISMKSLEDLVKKWQENPISPLNDWYNLQQNWLKLLRNAVNFLCGNNSNRPENFVPYIEYKLNLDMYQWIGAGRDNDNLLQSLFQYWLDHYNDDDCKKDDIVDISDRSQTPPPPRYPTTWTVRKATQDEICDYREQERQRYNNPHKAYTYRCNGYESVVGPLKGIYNNNIVNNTNTASNTTTKAPRGHTMLTDDRPNFVTILSLVRDATARLPNGEGTRSDICELLKSSQYINNTAPDNVLQSIVSGALDRMHTQLDPCVKYDQKRKMWIYLHRNRTEEDFERIHQQLQLISNKNKKQTVKKSSTTTSQQQQQKKVVKNHEKTNRGNNEATTSAIVTTTTTTVATTTTATTVTTTVATTTTTITTTTTATTSSGSNTNSLLITNQEASKTNLDELVQNKTKNLVRILSPNLGKSLIIPPPPPPPPATTTTIVKSTNNADDNSKNVKTNQFVQSLMPQQLQNIKNVTLIKNNDNNSSNSNNNNDKIEQIQIKTPANLTPAQQQQIIQTIKQKILPQAQILNQQQQQIILKQKPIVKQQQQQQQQSLLGQAKITEVSKAAVITSQTPVVAKVLTNAAGQVISVESLLAHQKQHGTLPQGTTLRVSKSGHPPNIIQLTGTGTPKFAVTSQNNLVALTTNTNQPKLIVASSSSLSSSSSSSSPVVVTATASITTTAPATSIITTTATTIKTLPRVIGTTTSLSSSPRFTSKQLINAKLITTSSAGTLTTSPQSRIFLNQQQQHQQMKVTTGKNLMLTKPVTLNVATGGNAANLTTNPNTIRMLNAANLNLTHIGGKPVLLASKGNTTIQNLQGHNVLLQTQQTTNNNNNNNSNNTNVSANNLVLQSTNIKTTLSQQVISGGSQLKIQQPQVVFSSGVKCAVTQQQSQPHHHHHHQQQIVLEGHPVRLQTNTSTNTAQRVVLAASQGQGGQIVAQQILLPAGFQGTAINIKALQGVKVIPLAQAQGRGIHGRPVFARVMSPTVVKTATSTATTTTQNKPPDPPVVVTTTAD